MWAWCCLQQESSSAIWLVQPTVLLGVDAPNSFYFFEDKKDQREANLRSTYRRWLSLLLNLMILVAPLVSSTWYPLGQWSLFKLLNSPNLSFLWHLVNDYVAEEVFALFIASTDRCASWSSRLRVREIETKIGDSKLFNHLLAGKGIAKKW